MNGNDNNEWCHYSGMPSPLYYMNNNNMNKDIKTIEHLTFNDNRGSYTPISTYELGIEWDQCSISINDKKGTFRGLHYQTNPPQTKYIKVVRGSIIDFMYNLDTKELLYFTLGSNQAILVPDNMAHGFLTLEDDTIVTYMVKGEYNPESEHSIVWNTIDEVKEIILYNLQGNDLIISHKDNEGK
jgi:dTDP-4-dehydrorhamnose 3,5-epimerase